MSATDPRDITYAALGLAYDAEELGIRPDNSKDVGTRLYEKFDPARTHEHSVLELGISFRASLVGS